MKILSGEIWVTKLTSNWDYPPMRREYQYSEDGGRWGVAQACGHLEIFNAVASLICANRYDMALSILENEIDENEF